MTLLATLTPSSSQNSNLSQNSPPSWLVEIYSKLWKRTDLFDQIFRTATLTKDNFKGLQDLLDKENPGRTSDLYVAKDVLAKKADFLREKSKPLEIDFGDGLVPRLVFDATQLPSSGVVDNDDVADDDNDVVADGDDDAVADDDNDDAMDIDPNHGYAGSHTDHLSKEAEAIFPYTIRYVDLTVLNLKNHLRAPLLMLFRNEWGTMIDIFNKSEKGREGSTVFTGQPGIGEHHYWYLTVTSNQQTRENMPVVFHPYPLHHSRPINCVPGYVRQGLHH
jgi:hypothetical protein